MSDYYKRLRKKVGHDLLVMPSVAAVIHDETDLEGPFPSGLWFEVVPEAEE